MKGRTATKSEKQWMDAICELGCIVCLDAFKTFSPGTVHHIDGKTKKDAHLSAICLCARHHQVASDSGEYATRHGPGRNAGKSMFEAAYGAERELLEKTKAMLPLLTRG